MRRLLPGLIVVAQALLCVIAAPALAVPVDVATRTALTIDASPVGRVLDVEVHLVDDVAQGMAFRPVTMTFTPADGAPIEVPGETDRLGDLTWSGTLAEGPWTVDVVFDGDPWHEPANTTTTIELARRPVQVDLDVAQTVGVGRDTVPMIVEARSAGRALDGHDAVHVIACGEAVDAVYFDAGRALVDVPVPDGPTACDVHASIPASDRHLGGEAFAVVRVVGAAGLTLDASEADRGPFEPPRFVASGQVTDPAGAVGGARVVVTMGDEAQAEARTDAAGDWAVELVTPGLGAGTWPVEARLILDASEGDPVLATATASVTRTRTAIDEAPLLVGLALAALVLIALAARLFEWRRGPGRRRRAAAKPTGVAGAAIEAAAAAAPVADRVEVRVLDAHHERPVHAAVTLTPTAGDAAHDAPLRIDAAPAHVEPAGATRWHVDVSAPGYLPLAVDVAVPRPGHRLVVRIVSVRARVRDALREVAEGLDVEVARGAWWGRASTSEIASAVRGALRTLRHDGEVDVIARRRLGALLARLDAGEVDTVEAWDALTLLVDDVYFSDRVYAPAVIEVAERLAALVRDGAAPTPRAA